MSKYSRGGRGLRNMAPGLHCGTGSFSGTVRSIANKLPTEPRMPGTTKPRRDGGNIRVPDDVVKALLWRWMAGESMAKLAAECDTNYEVFQRWCNGENRGHLLDEVERAFRNHLHQRSTAART